MWKRLGVPLAVLPLAACLWLPRGPDARPRLGLESVERAPAHGAGAPRGPVAEPGVRGWLFADSVIVLRTRAGTAGVRFRIWNRMGEPMHVSWDPAPAPAGRSGASCPAASDAWVLAGGRTAAPPDAIAPGGSWEAVVQPAARLAGTGEAWRTVPLPCLVFDPAEPRVALRLRVQAGTRRFGYTFWYRLMAPPREDPAEVAARTEGAARSP
jgi:hypothetical protein